MFRSQLSGLVFIVDQTYLQVFPFIFLTTDVTAQNWQCGGKLTGITGYIALPGYGSRAYDHNLFCVWEMDHLIPGDIIVV